jgi:hypothetical protein
LLHPVCLLILPICYSLASNFLVLYYSFFVIDWNCCISLNSFTFVAVYLHWVYCNCLFNLLAYYYFRYFHPLFSTFFFLRTFSWLLKFILVLNVHIIACFPHYRTCSYHSCDVYVLHLFSWLLYMFTYDFAHSPAELFVFELSLFILY